MCVMCAHNANIGPGQLFSTVWCAANVHSIHLLAEFIVLFLLV